MHVAEQSSRVCKDGSLRWYAGDTFLIVFDFHLQDASGEPVEISPTDVAEVCFRDYKNEVVAKFTETGSSAIEVGMTSEISARFKAGVYAIDVRLNGTYVTTIMHNNRVVVE
ncbi:MAG TPA: hypothetical protein PLE59_01000 [Bacteroidales bacterium]|jgi:hypothetical protein|nr:MAG: hypothetical protein BWX59_01313 [Bacteroidetes bacterium ADurb.Bin028]HNZ77233.1 hypothetical protein [Bacilli bacterium]HOE15187.1 hypothetical protein [Candidatus Paceibacterota bacterium]HPL02075.1 hypothetical protein [Bacteroidales bacterium]HQL11800.1 hypothetical protein [bacterium]